jgi:hypothetical protein
VRGSHVKEINAFVLVQTSTSRIIRIPHRKMLPFECFKFHIPNSLPAGRQGRGASQFDPSDCKYQIWRRDTVKSGMDYGLKVLSLSSLMGL